MGDREVVDCNTSTHVLIYIFSNIGLVVEFRLLQFVSVFSAVFAGRCASGVGFGGLSFVPRTFPCCLVFLVVGLWLFWAAWRADG